MALKLFVYPKEVIQIESLKIWNQGGISCAVFAEPEAGIVILERILIGTIYTPSNFSAEVSKISHLLKTMDCLSPKTKPYKSTLLTDHFEERLLRARVRNQKSDLYSIEKIEAIENLWRNREPFPERLDVSK